MGEHRWPDQPEYVPTTGGLPTTDWEYGTVFPAIGVTAAWDEVDELDPSVSLHIRGLKTDLGVDLRPREARMLVDAIEEALAVLKRR